MATYESVRMRSEIAGAALTIYQFVSLQADGKYDPSGAAALIDGICGETVAADLDSFPMVLPDHSRAKVLAGAAVSVGDLVESNAAGRAITATSGVGNGLGGVALTAASADGDIIEIDFSTSVDEVA